MFSFAVSVSEKIAAARSPPASEPACNQFFLPRGIGRMARSAALLSMQARPSRKTQVRRNVDLVCRYFYAVAIGHVVGRKLTTEVDRVTFKSLLHQCSDDLRKGHRAGFRAIQAGL